MLRLIAKLIDLLKMPHRHHRAVERLLLAQGAACSAINKDRHASLNLTDYEFSIFSQWGEDGIIDRLVSVLPISSETFIEFGVENFSEANCRFLMQHRNWRGMVIDGSEKNIHEIKTSGYYWKHDLLAECSFITAENIGGLLSLSGFPKESGIISVDIDGVDYWVLSALEDYRPAIFIVEYNAVLGGRAVSVPYRPDFDRTSAHPSNLYWGASLSAFEHLLSRRGYALVGTARAGGNAFFVREDLLGDRFPKLSAEEAFTESRFRESRGPKGELTYAVGENRLRIIAGLPVINVVTGATESL